MKPLFLQFGFRKLTLWVAICLAVGAWFVAKNIDFPPVAEAPTVLGKTVELEPIECYQAWRCTFNVVGVENVLGRSVMVHINGIRAPRWGATCSAESDEGSRATSYLFEMLASANNITLIRPYKVEGGHELIGRVLVDGKDVAHRLIDLGVAVPPGVKMNWCKAVKNFEV